MAAPKTVVAADLTAETVVRRSDRKRTATAKVLAMRDTTTGTGTSKPKGSRRGSKKTKRTTQKKVQVASSKAPLPSCKATATSAPSQAEENGTADVPVEAESSDSAPVATAEPPSGPQLADAAEVTNVTAGEGKSSALQGPLTSSELEADAINQLKRSYKIKKLSSQIPFMSNGLTPAFTWDKGHPTDSDTEQSSGEADDADNFSDDLSFTTTVSYQNALAITKAFVAEQTANKESAEPDAPGPSTEDVPTTVDEGKEVAKKGKGRAKSTKKKPAAKKAKPTAKASRPAKGKATKTTAVKIPADATVSNASEGVDDKSPEKENANGNAEEASADNVADTTPEAPATKDADNLKVASGSSNSPPRKPLSGISPLPQSQAVDSGSNAASGSELRKRARDCKPTVAASTNRYCFRALKAPEEQIKEGPKPKRARH